jgi:hypothetical protein
MNALQRIVHMNGRKFDLIFGFVLLFGGPIALTRGDLGAHPGTTALFGFLIYFLEAWAYRYKLISVRARAVANAVSDKSGDGQLPPLSSVIRLGRNARVLLRVLLFSISMTACLNYVYGDNDPPSSNWIKGLLLASILFEVWLHRGVYFESARNGKVKTKKKKGNDSEGRVAVLSDKETEWRREYSSFTEGSYHIWKEIASDCILMITGLMFAQSYWSSSFNFFTKAIEDAHSKGVSPGSILWTMFFVTTLTSFFVLFPARLVYWAEENWNAESAKKGKIRWSIFLAFAGLTAPIYYRFITVYFF